MIRFEAEEIELKNFTNVDTAIEVARVMQVKGYDVLINKIPNGFKLQLYSKDIGVGAND